MKYTGNEIIEFAKINSEFRRKIFVELKDNRVVCEIINCDMYNDDEIDHANVDGFGGVCPRCRGNRKLYNLREDV